MSTDFVAQGLSQQSAIPADAVDNMNGPDQFPFLKLPPEIRNMIYRLVVVTKQHLVVRDMHLEEFYQSRNNGAFQLRSTYQALDHICNKRYNRYLDLEPCFQKDPRFGPLKTTYTLGTPHSLNTETATMLSLNKQSREETASIFYRENTFEFSTMSALVPFMKDRTVETRKYIQRLCFTLTISGSDLDAVMVEHSKPAAWNKAFSSLLKLSHVNIRYLCVRIDDLNAQILTGVMNMGSRSMLWLHKLSRFQDLETLGLEHIAPCCNLSRQPHPSLGWSRPVYVNDTEEELWNFLAPRMLKKKTDDHSPDALEHRRIWDIPYLSE